MKPAPAPDWHPDPQLLAAYFDGELEGRGDLAELRAKVETWLDGHREARRVADEHRRLRKIVRETAPAEPDEQTWKCVLDRIEGARRRPAARRAGRGARLAAGACAAAILLAVGALVVAMRYADSSPMLHQAKVVAPRSQTNAPDANDLDVFPVVAAEDVLILRVDGQDTDAVVVGELPMQGPMELAAPGEVRVFAVRPDERDRLPKVRQDGANRPMIYAQLDTDRE